MKRFLVPAAILLALAFLPKLSIDIPYLFESGLNTPGTLELLALCLLFGGLALSYDLLFGFTGLLSFGHALYFAIGVYISAIAMTRWHWDFWVSIAFTAIVGFVVAAILGAVSLRVAGIAFAMVTLAFAQAGLDPGVEESRTAGPAARRDSASTTTSFRRGRSASSTRSICTGSRSATRRPCSRSCVGPSTRRRAMSGRRSARTSFESRCWD